MIETEGGGEMDRRQDERRSGVRIRIVPEVSIADLLTVAGIGLPLLVWGARLDARVEQIERQITELRIEDQRQTAERDKLRIEVRDELREIRKDINTLSSYFSVNSYGHQSAPGGRK